MERVEDDADQRPAADFGVTDGGETSWYVEDEQAAVNIVERDGELFASLEPFRDG